MRKPFILAGGWGVFLAVVLAAAPWETSTGFPPDGGTQVQTRAGRGGDWMLAGDRLYLTTDGGVSYSTSSSAPAGISALFEPETGPLFAIVEGSGIYTSPDSGASFKFYPLATALTAPSFVDQAVEPLILDRNGLYRLSLQGSAAAISALFSSPSGNPKAAQLGQNIYLAYSSGTSLMYTFSGDGGTTFRTPVAVAALVPSARVAGIHFSSAKEGRILLLDDGGIVSLVTTDGGASFAAFRAAASYDVAKPVILRRLGGADLLLYVASGTPQFSESVDGGRSYKAMAVESWQGQPGGGWVLSNGAVHWFSGAGTVYRLARPFDLHPLDQAQALPLAKAVEIEWAAHPLATSYDIYRSGTYLGSSTAPPFRHLTDPLSGGTYSVVPRRSNFQGTGAKAELASGAVSSARYLITAGSTMEDYRMISVPYFASVKNGGEEVTVQAYLESVFGSQYNPSIWRLGVWDPELGDYRTGTEIGGFRPGAAYWILAAFSLEFAVERRDNTAARSLIRLKPGWNTLATPYLESTPWTQISVLDGMREMSYEELAADPATPLIPDLWQWQAAGYSKVANLEPGSGYWVKNVAGRDLLLVLKKSSGSGAQKPLASARRSSGETPPLPPAADGFPARARASGGGCFLMGS